MAMEVALGSRPNVREVLEMLEKIESTRFQDLPDGWIGRTLRVGDYNPGRTRRGAYFVFYKPWLRRIIDSQTAW